MFKRFFQKETLSSTYTHSQAYNLICPHKCGTNLLLWPLPILHELHHTNKKEKSTWPHINIPKQTHTHTHTHTHTLKQIECVLLSHVSHGKSGKSDVKNWTIFFPSIKGKNTHPLMTFPPRENMEETPKTKHKYNTLISWWKLPPTEKPHLREISKISEYFFVSWSFFEVVGFHMCKRLKTQFPELLEGLFSSINYLQTFFYF